MNEKDKALSETENEMRAALTHGVIPFWLDRSVDCEYGGYLTCFDEKGRFTGNGVKYLVTQCRMVWGFSNLAPFAPSSRRAEMEAAARAGVRFLTEKFWDTRHGGFFWQLNRDGSLADPAKLVYGESFAIYALSEFFLAYGDKTALSYAEKTFELLQIHAADTQNGGYYENIEADWRLSPFGASAGDRKSLDIHMHLMEAFTTLYKATGKEIHARKFREVMGLILSRMVNREAGYGLNQFDPRFRPLPAIDIPRTWNAEREVNEKVETPTDTTSYGHNVELSWLAHLALETLNDSGDTQMPILRRLLDHSLRHGYDFEYGGVYRDGAGEGSALILDKEWWQNFEALVGYLNGYMAFSDAAYLDAFAGTWALIREKFFDWEIGESRQLLNRQGEAIVGSLGNPWKGIYHTGRALAESIRRLQYLREKGIGLWRS